MVNLVRFSQKDKSRFSLRKRLAKINRKKLLKILVPILVVLFILGVAGYFFIFVPARKVFLASQETYQHLNKAKNAFYAQNFTKLADEIKASEGSLDNLKSEYQYFSLLGKIPFLGQYYQDGEHALEAGGHALIAAQILTEGIKPFSDVLGFKQDEGTKDLTAEEKLAYLVQVMPQILPSVDAASEELKTVREEIDQIDPERYPEKIGDLEVKTSIKSGIQAINDIEDGISEARPFLEVLPDLLGRSETKNYLILFQNDKELRPTGGFITAYALVAFNQGKFSVVQSEDIYRVDSAQDVLPIPGPIREYMMVHYMMRDTNFSPDFKQSMQDFEAYWQSNGLPSVDGVIGIDTEFVRSFLEVLGPIHLEKYNETFEASNIVYELELYSEKILKGGARKALLGDLMMAMVDRVFAAKKDKWQPLIERGMKGAQEKHVLFYLHEEKAQKFAEKFNFAGRIKDYDDNYLHINDANLGGLKSDMYVERKIDLKINVGDDGTVKNTLTITYTNTGEYDGWLNSITRDYVRVYVPKGSKLLSATGGERVPVDEYEDLEKAVFANWTETYPAGLGVDNYQVITFEYELPFKVNKIGSFGKTNFNLLIQKQPGLIGPEYSVEVNGQKQEFKLETDKELKFEL